MFVAMVVASFAAVLASFLAGMLEFPGIHWMWMKKEMELMQSWIVDIRGHMKTYEDISVQIIMVIEEWLPLVNVQFKANHVSDASSSYNLPFLLIVANTSGCRTGTVVITAAALLFPVLSLADPSL